MEQTDHEGRPVPENEPDDAEILVWDVEPHPQRPHEYTSMVERSWQKMLEYVRGELDCMLESCDLEDLLDEPLVIKFRLQKMRKSEYMDIVSGD